MICKLWPSGKNCGYSSCYGLERLPLLPVPLVGAEVLTTSLPQVKGLTQLGGHPLSPTHWNFGGQWVGEGWQTAELRQPETSVKIEANMLLAEDMHTFLEEPLVSSQLLLVTLAKGPNDIKLKQTWKWFEFWICSPSDGQTHHSRWRMKNLTSEIRRLEWNRFLEKLNHQNWCNNK